MSDPAGTLLDGWVRHAQPAAGHRTGIEPVLLAASIAARPGERVLEGGTGSGAALLCLGMRLAGISGVGIERDPAMAAVARANLAANGLTRMAVLEGDIAATLPEGAFDHAFANPPWHAASGTASPDAGREAARRAAPETFALWVTRLATPLRHRGTLTLVVATAVLPECLAALRLAGCGSTALLPLWPKPGRAAKLLLLRGVKGGRAPFRLLAGLTLHRPDGRFTDAAEAVLRDGATLSFAGDQA